MLLSKHLAALVIVPALALGSYSSARIIKTVAASIGSLTENNEDSEDSNSSSSSSRRSSSSSSSSRSSSSSSFGFNLFSSWSTSSRYSSSSTSSRTNEQMYQDYLQWLQENGSSVSSVITDLQNATSSRISSESRSSELRFSSSSTSSLVLSATSSSVTMLSASSVSSEQRSQGSSSVIEPIIVPEPSQEELGCFTDRGDWTVDRDLCAESQNQINFIREQAEKESRLDAVPPEQTEDDVTLEIRISERFEDEAIRTRRRSELISVIQEARTKIESLIRREGISEETKTYFIQSVQWFSDAQEYFSSEARSDLDISRMITATQETLSNVTTLIQNERIVPTGNANITSIVERTDRLLKKFFQSFTEIGQTGEPLDQTAVDSYIEAQTRFDSLKAPCLERNEGCENIDAVLELLSKAKRFLEEGFEKHPEARAKVEAMFQ